MIIAVAILFLIFIDQITKLAVHRFLSKSIKVIDNTFSLTYAENRGAAFSIFQNKQIFIEILSIVVVICLIVFLYKQNINSNKNKPKLINLSIVLILAGTIGNLIDRLWHGYVIDFLDFEIIKFPIFNFADCFIVIGSLLFCYYIIFYDLEKTHG